jgi:hypothetical protein
VECSVGSNGLHPLHSWFSCHGVASWDDDSEVLGS